MTEHPLFAHFRARTWLKIALLAMLPLSLCWVIAERASWKPRTFAGARANVFQVAFSPDGKYLAVAAQSDEVVHLRPHERFPASDRKFDDAVDIWDAQGRTRLHSIKLSGRALGSIAFSPDGRELAGLVSWRVGNRAGHANGHEVRVWDASTGKLKRRLHIGYAFSHHLFWTGNVLTFSSGGVRQWDARTGKDMGSLLGDDDEAALSPDGKMLAFSNGSETLREIQAPNRSRLLSSSSKIKGGTSLLTFSRDGSLLAACIRDPDGGSSDIQLWNGRQGRQSQIIHSSHAPRALALSPDNRLVATGDDDNAIRLWDVRSGALLRTLRESPARTLAFSPDGSTLASGRGNGTFTLWRIK